MLKRILGKLKSDRDQYKIPRRVQDVIPIKRMWTDGIFLVGNKYTKTFRFSDINYQVASEDDKEHLMRRYGELINSLDIGAVTKITVNNRHINERTFAQNILRKQPQIAAR